MNQLNLFGEDPPLSRRSDPKTSKQAEQNTLPKLAGLHLLFFQTLQRCRYPATAQEVAADAVPFEPNRTVQATFSRRESVRKRAKELERMGLIVAVGSRICQVTGNNSTIYKVKEGHGI